jgi:YbbR domain-containing protein
MIASLRNLLFHDFWLKLFALALAVLIWLTVSFIQSGGGQNLFTNRSLPERTFPKIPVLVVSSAADVRDFKVHPSEVEVVVQGDARLIQSLQARDIRALVDLTDIESARGLTERIEVTAPRGITLTRVTPEQVDVIMPPRH